MADTAPASSAMGAVTASGSFGGADLSAADLNLGAGSIAVAAAAAAGPSSEALLLPGDSPPVYQYSQEIAQMMFVFGDIEDPPADVLKLIEDIVRTQVVEMIIQSRRISQRRASRSLAPEDLIFLIRYDRAKVNRLRIYLSWREVRKKAKESDDVGTGAAGDADLDDAGAMDATVKPRKMNIKLPWELSTIYSEHLRPLAGDDDAEEDEDDIEAHEDSMSRLKEADEATRRMTREEYVHYSECRQASFTFRKGKKFRDFINAPAYLDGGKPNDDIIDILGFLAFEVVRELCEGALKVQRELEETARLLAERRRRALEEDRAREREADSAERRRGLRPVQDPASPSKDTARTKDNHTPKDVTSNAAPTSPEASRGADASRQRKARGDGEESVVRTGILKVTNGSTTTSPAAAEGTEDASANRPRKRARFVEPAAAEQSRCQAAQVSGTPSSTPGQTSDEATTSADPGRGHTLLTSRTYDAVGAIPPVLSSLFLPAAGVKPDPSDASTFCSIFAPLPGASADVSASPSPSLASASKPRFTSPKLAPTTASKNGGANKRRRSMTDEEGDNADGDGDEDDAEGGSGSDGDDAEEVGLDRKEESGEGGVAEPDKDKDNGGADAASVDKEGATRRDKPPPPQLATSHIYEAFARLQRRRAALAGASRTGGTGGLRRTRMFVI